MDDWLPYALETFDYDSETVLIGHSAGATLILSILENIDVSIRQAVLVAGFCKPLDGGSPHPILQPRYDWKRIKSHSKEFIFINSDDDPWGCNAEMGRELLDQLGGFLIVPKGQGHMGSQTFEQPYREFPLLLKLTV